MTKVIVASARRNRLETLTPPASHGASNVLFHTTGGGGLAGMVKVTNGSTEITWSPEARVAGVRYTPGVTLGNEDGDFLVDALNGWIGKEGERFAILADAAGLHGTDAAYRARAGGFFRQHRATAFIALINLGPVIHVVVELFRVGTGIQLKTFASELAARSWLRTKSIAV